MIKSKRFPIFSTLIFGKIFDYKYVNKINLKDKKFTCTIDEIDEKKNNFLFVSEDLYKNESLFDEVFPLKILLEKELNLLKEWPCIIQHEEDFNWKSTTCPKYPNGYVYIIEIDIKNNLEIDFELLSKKLKLHIQLNEKLKQRNTTQRSKI